MAKQNKGFFKGGAAKLNREINKQREADAKTANKGFIGQIRRADTARHKKHQEETKDFQDRQYRGQDTVERTPEVKAPEKNQDPSQAEADSPDKGFSGQLNWNANNPRNF